MMIRITNRQGLCMTPTQIPTPQLKQIKQVSDGWIKKYILRYELPDGSLISYEGVSRKGPEDYSRELMHDAGYIHKSDAVCIVPRTTTGELVLIKEFRYPLNSWVIAFPAGLVDGDEDLFNAVTRELQEETGYGICTIDGKPQYHALSRPGYSSTGMSEESVQVVYALVEKIGEPKPEPNEFIEVFTVLISDLERFLNETTLPIGTRAQLILESIIHRSGYDLFKND